MAEESRDYPRAQLPAVRARYENAAGTSIESEVLDVGRGGVFIKTDAPLTPGKRLALELIVVGEPRPISVVARVVWVRQIAASIARPEGMGLKFIDLEEDAEEQIGALVHTRERTIQGIGFGGGLRTPEIDPELLAGNPPVFIADARDPLATGAVREQTLAGVGDAIAAATHPGRERTLLGIEASGGAGRERSIPIGLVTKKPHVDTFETDDRPSSPSDDTQPSRLRASMLNKPKKRTGVKWAWAIALVAAAGGVGYAYRDRLTGFVRAASEPEKASPPVAPAPVVSSVPSGPSVAIDLPDASAANIIDASTIALGEAIADASVVGAHAHDAAAIDAGKKVTPPRPKPKPRTKAAEEDNPY